MKHKVRMTVIVTDDDNKSHRKTITLKDKNIYKSYGVVCALEEAYVFLLSSIELKNGWRVLKHPSYDK